MFVFFPPPRDVLAAKGKGLDARQKLEKMRNLKVRIETFELAQCSSLFENPIAGWQPGGEESWWNYSDKKGRNNQANRQLIIFSQVGGKIELSTKTKASTAGAADDNTKTQIGRLTKTVSSSGKVEISMVSYSRTRRTVMRTYVYGKILNIMTR